LKHSEAMININSWAEKWRIPAAAIDEMRAALLDSLPHEPAVSAPPLSEAGVQSRVRLEASQKGLRLWRNNVGAMYDQNGNFIRYGLANDSKNVNQTIKSSDLIGIRPLKTPWGLIGQFVAREMKREGWTYSGTEEEQAQLKFLMLVFFMGGDAQFCTREGTL
jgi:hypothetical protein